LPRLAAGDRVTAADVTIADKQTKPPRPFTDATLIAAMCAVGKFVRRPEIRKVLTETDGIGTPATRAAILETLFARGYVVRADKSIVSTETGRALIRALPEVATTPDMTALWELGMRAIAERRQPLDDFLGRVEAQLQGLVAEGRAVGRVVIAGPAPRSRAGTRRSAPPSAARVSRAPRAVRRSR
jgi:DNA topoisomerase-3